ncbi:MAG: hypothetical protein NTV51_03490 [Verrucomicrobia bacterium]|nr:hypothetical protein [Verrucomicrobiota bacterium]
MKTSYSSETERPRLICRVVQGWVSVVGDGAAPAPGGWGARHVAGCACCQGFFGMGRELDAALRRGAQTQFVAAAPGLEQRINDAIARSVREAAAPTRRSRPGLAMGSWALAGAAASLVVAVLVSQRLAGPAEATRNPGAPLVSTGEPDGSLTGDGLLDRWEPKATALLEGEPLQREVEAVYSDARSALGFLALNFLPKTPDDTGVGAMPSRRPAGG